MSNVNENDTKVLKSKRFVVRMSLVGKNQMIEFTTKSGKKNVKRKNFKRK